MHIYSTVKIIYILLRSGGSIQSTVHICLWPSYMMHSSLIVPMSSNKQNSILMCSSINRVQNKSTISHFSNKTEDWPIRHVIIQPFIVKIHVNTLQVLYCYLHTPRTANQYFKWLTKLHIGWPFCPSNIK